MIKLIVLKADKEVGDRSFVSREKLFMLRSSEDIREIDWGLFWELKQLWAEEISLYNLEEYSKIFEKMKEVQKKLETWVQYDAKKRKELDKKYWY